MYVALVELRMRSSDWRVRVCGENLDGGEIDCAASSRL